MHTHHFTENDLHQYLSKLPKTPQGKEIRQILTKFYTTMRRKTDDFGSDHTIRTYLHTAAKLLTGELTERNSRLSQYRQARAVITHLRTFKLVPTQRGEALGFTDKKRNKNRDARQRKRIREKYVSPEIFQQFLERLPNTEKGQELHLSCRIAYHAGTRLAETLSLTPRDFELTDDMILVYVRSGKGDKDRVTALPLSFHEEITPFAGFSISYEYTRDMTAKYMKKLGYAFTFHAFRHSASTHFADAGVHPFTMAEMLGHSDPKMTMHYTHTTIQDCTELKALFQC